MMTIATNPPSGPRLYSRRLLYQSLPERSNSTIGGTRCLSFPSTSNLFPRPSSSPSTAKTRVAYREDGIHRDKGLSRNTGKSDFRAYAFQRNEVHSYTEEELRIATGDFSEFNKLGSGGFGDVYRGCIGHTPVAVKRCRLKNTLRFQFQLEIDVLTKMRHHPNVVQLYGVCYDNYCLVFELVSNGCLEDHLGRLSWETQVKIAIDITNALVAIHRAGFVHRDVKPANILLDDNFQAKLADFGLATQVENGVEFRGYFVGTHYYCDPVYRDTGEVGAYVDVYSLGKTFLQLLDLGRSEWPLETLQRAYLLGFKCVTPYRDGRPDLGRGMLPKLKGLLPKQARWFWFFLFLLVIFILA